MKLHRRKFLAMATAIPATLAMPGIVRAQSWKPNRVVTFLSPFAAGGTFDVTERALARAAEPIIGQTITVVNRAGAAGTVALGELARAKPDGLTLGLMSVSNNAVAPQMVDLSFDPVSDFTPLVTYASFLSFLIVKSDSPLGSYKDWIDFARKQPKKLTVGISTLGSNSHLLMARLAAEEGVELSFVPFGGGAPALTAVLGGHVMCALLSGEALAPQREGTIRMLAVLNKDKVEEFPDVPNMADLGFKWASLPWVGMGAPKGLPEEITKRWSEVLLEATYDKAFLQALSNLAFVPTRMGPADMGKMMSESLAEHEKIVKSLGLGRFASK
ncbi:tripartite tricarboxylate transporter substrate binding protein [Agrobacterium sp. LAD9]|uniref:Bug family tripartite tricarboxylate transporter substrate binding protein n=1 Tax=Agrobacterium sp. LAD9 TaxID=2055153 RepID=UPI000D1E23E0|nr:tripartite tricarboxylate transporter substrate binding protein [Agrobacterium sp. LAD9]